jgi:hypothetical protein
MASDFCVHRESLASSAVKLFFPPARVDEMMEAAE